MLTYKKASLNDIPIIMDLAERSWKVTYKDIISAEQIEYMFNNSYSYDPLKNQMAEQGHTFLIAYEEENPVGFASFSLIGKTTFKLHKLYVVPETQGKGIGRYLVEAVIREVKRLGASILELNVNRYNAKAKAFYDRIGFEVYKEVDIPLGDFFLNDYILRKKL
ncbi:GNAT family N-acetyltransferase [Solitalea koreensis]|uniref:Ribosomal protein S18 acetylase RimI n=1 Tax=Solitalea koreensis TaxID=543615 RepID=A0A521CBU4_9SPHI|nr:GNAT family N-acetyltransferase [Solitalea koreensis]SMO56230.1 Ribosomal protein S18 acetylase RimI [Solitalea koreensis]